jgi:hypothetical protein
VQVEPPVPVAYPKRPDTRFEGVSEAQASFVPHAVQPVTAPAVSGASPRPNARFEASSTYRADFTEKASEPIKPAPAAAWKPMPTKFEAESEAHARYREFNVSDPSQIRWEGPKVNQPVRQSAPFDATTTFRNDFRQWEVKPEAPVPVPSPAKPNIPFSGVSEARDRFREWELQAGPAHAQGPAYAPRPDDRDFLSEAHKQYTEKHVETCPVDSLPPPPLPSVRPSAWDGQHVLYDPGTHRYA